MKRKDESESVIYVPGSQMLAKCMGNCLFLLCAVAVALAVVQVVHAWKVIGTKALWLFYREDGTLMVIYTLPDGVERRNVVPFQEHKAAIERARREKVWVHPAQPDAILYYGNTWPVPATGCILLAIFLPMLLAHLVALAKK